MIGDKVVQMFAPDPVQMRLHVDHLFGDQAEGVIELAWTTPATGALDKAELFALSQIDQLIAKAIEVNSIEGQSVYIGAALRHPGTPPFGRSSDRDHFRTPAFYVDLDDPGAAEAAVKKYEACRPTFAVVTGRYPHKRMQLWWKAAIPLTDPDAHRSVMEALAAALGGDPTVVNPSRVMRLGGSIAWPSVRKEGRVTEMTEARLPTDGRPKIIAPGQIDALFPTAAQPNAAAPLDFNDAPRQFADRKPSPHRAPISGRLSVESLLTEIRANRLWHNNVNMLIGHWIMAGWSDAEILATAAGITIHPYTVDQTIAEMRQSIAGGRAKWAKPDPQDEFAGEFDAETGKFTDDIKFKLVPFGDIVPVLQQRYLVKGLISHESLIIAWGPPKCGKSFWFSDVALHIACGMAYRNLRVRQGPVVYIAAEGAIGFMARVDAWRSRRLAEGHGHVPFHLLPMRLDLVADHIKFVNDVKVQVGDLTPVLVVIDTLNRTFTGSESADEDMTAYVRAADAIKEAFKCSVAVVHHCGVEGTRPRGHTSLTGAADTQIAILRDETGLISARVEWMKDGPEGYENRSRLETVEIGIDEDGDPVTTCIIVNSDDQMADPKAKLSAPLFLALQALKQAVSEAGEVSNQSHIPSTCRVVPTGIWRKTYYLKSTEESPNGTQDARRVAFGRAATELQAKGVIGVWNDFVWVIE